MDFKMYTDSTIFLNQDWTSISYWHWWTHFAAQNLIKNIIHNTSKLYMHKTYLHTKKIFRTCWCSDRTSIRADSKFSVSDFSLQNVSLQKGFAEDLSHVFDENWNYTMLFQTELNSLAFSHICGALGASSFCCAERSCWIFMRFNSTGETIWLWNSSSREIQASKAHSPSLRKCTKTTGRCNYHTPNKMFRFRSN